MLAIERKNEILAILQKEQRVLVSELSKRYDVTDETIRRDLEKLESEGFVKRTYGGAVLNKNKNVDMPLRIREKTNRENACQLAGRVLSLPGYQGLKGLSRIPLERLMKLKGIGNVKAVQLKCVAELAARMSRAEAAERLCFDAPETVADYFMEDLRYAEQEQLHALFLNTKNGLLKEKLLFQGTVNASLVSPREIFLEALECHAVRLVLVHNHPSGDAMPSPEDIRMTHRIYEAGEMLGIQLLDHIIIGDRCYSSFRERGILSEK